jgi:phosphonate transport system substrate-binding protein
MRRNPVSKYPLAALAAAFFLSSCSSTHASSNRYAGGRPAVLRYCFTSTAEQPDAVARRLGLVKNYLARTLHVEVEAVQTTAYGAVIEAFRANKIDVASISPFSYIIATEKAPIEAIVMRANEDGGAGEYTGVLAVPGNSPIRSIDDLKKHAKELTISFVDPASASGFLVENAFLQSIGIEPQRDFKKVVFSMNHPASLMTLKAGKVDVAASMERIINQYQETGKLAKGDVRIIWTSPPIPSQPIAVRKDLPAGFIEEIRRAFIDMPKTDPQAWENLNPASVSGLLGSKAPFVPANDAMFDGLRQMARNVKNLSLLEH